MFIINIINLISLPSRCLLVAVSLTITLYIIPHIYTDYTAAGRLANNNQSPRLNRYEAQGNIGKCSKRFSFLPFLETKSWICNSVNTSPEFSETDVPSVQTAHTYLDPPVMRVVVVLVSSKYFPRIWWFV